MRHLYRTSIGVIRVRRLYAGLTKSEIARVGAVLTNRF